eukprot:TRINITY_DN2013_c0_g1_i3.p1 TRINITY_DN2013_c0_g1~~TRINITY_DN2013_c0_g1_i3.p1  ORF type:complete len:407 (+),score=122.39 TRINITY_DN2013_c0_g1_i3:35-1255(+)
MLRAYREGGGEVEIDAAGVDSVGALLRAVRAGLALEGPESDWVVELLHEGTGSSTVVSSHNPDAALDDLGIQCVGELLSVSLAIQPQALAKLRARGIDGDAAIRSALQSMFAAAKEDTDVSKDELEVMSLIATAGKYPLKPVIQWGGRWAAVAEPVLRACIDGGADFAQPNFDRYKGTALHLAAELGRVPLVGALLDNGAAVDARNEYEETPLHCAMSNRRWEAAEVLLARGASVRGGSADKDRERDLLMKSVIKSIPSLASKSDEFIDERVDKLKKQEKAIAKLLQKEGDEAGMALMAKVFHEDEVARADKIMMLKTWTRVMCRKNYFRLDSFPREFLAVMLGMVDPDWQDALPTGSKDVLCCYVTSWVSNYHPPEARRRGRKRAAEEAEAEAASAIKRPKLATR